MKTLKIILFCAAGMVLCYGAFKGSIGVIENINAQYEPESPAVSEEADANPYLPTGIDKTISHSVIGTEETVLPIEYEQDHTIYEGQFYVTVNQGQTWLPVPDDTEVGYARISDYQDQILSSQIYISGEKVFIAYGGRGPENISMITTDTRGEAWSVGSISRTATNDLENGYDKMYIDFIEDGNTGYFAAVRKDGEVLAFRSVNSGVTWDPVTSRDSLFNEITAYFELQGMLHEEE